MYIVANVILMASFALWLTASSYPMLVAFGLVMGVGYGGVAAMSPAVAAAIFGIEGLGELLGILFTGFGVACVIGPPIAGAMADYTHDYKWPVFLAAGASVFGLLLTIPLRHYQPKPAEQQDRAAGAA
jgi:MFS family permease